MSHGYLKFLIASFMATCFLSASAIADITISVYVSGNGRDQVGVFAIDDCFAGPHTSGSCQTDSSGYCSIPGIRDLGTDPSNSCNYMKITPSKPGCTFNPQMGRILYSPSGITASFQASCCTNDCTDGAKLCVSGQNAYQTCGYGSDGCLHWGSPVNCQTGLTCQNGQCLDITPPVRSGGSPTGSLPVGTTQTPVSLTTNEASTCKYSLNTANTPYSSMANQFVTTGGTAHSMTVVVANGQSYNYYVRCSDVAGNANTDDYAISFTVQQQETTPPNIWVTANPPAANVAWQMSASASVACSDTGGSGCYASSYRIYLSGSQISSCPNDYSQYALTSPQTITSHSWVCAAGKDLAGNANFSYSMEFRVDQLAPAASIGYLPLWANQTSFNVSWSGTDEGGSGIAYFGVQYSDDSGNWANWLTALSTQNSYATFNTGMNNHTYSFRVNATDAAGNSGQYSSPASTTVDTAKPTCAIQNMPAYQSSSDFMLIWSGADGESGVKEYIVEQRTASLWMQFHRGPETSKDIINANDGTYRFRCRAIDNANNMGDLSAEKSTTVDMNPPEAQMNFSSSVYVNDSLSINARITDAIRVSNVTLYYENAVVPGTATQNPNYSVWDVSWTISGLVTAGMKTFTISVQDVNGNSRNYSNQFLVAYCTPGEVIQGCKCGTGTKTCRNDGTWSECTGVTKQPTTEVCDGEDNDCLGIIDDVNGGNSIQSTQCQCFGSSLLAATNEICDGIDNDCDGQIDENGNCCNEGDIQPCGTDIGICSNKKKTCAGGTWGPCTWEQGPGPTDICGNGLDDNCNGEVDENCASCTDRDGDGYGDPASNQCTYSGQDCDDSNPNVNPGSPEVCDGMDNNCNGQIDDEGLSCNMCTNGVQDSNEEGTDCGGDCPPCFVWGWLWLTAGGVVILLILAFVWFHFRKQGRELTWEELKKKWTPSE